jgi:hypothetical protein
MPHLLGVARLELSTVGQASLLHVGRVERIQARGRDRASAALCALY